MGVGGVWRVKNHADLETSKIWIKILPLPNFSEPQVRL